MRDGLRILDADAHVIEPGGLFGDARAGRQLIDLPPTTPISLAATPTCSPTSSSTASTRRRTCGRWTRRASTPRSLYPSMGLFVPFQPELDGARPRRARCRAYNEWIAGYCATDPKPARRRRHRAARRSGARR